MSQQAYGKKRNEHRYWAHVKQPVILNLTKTTRLDQTQVSKIYLQLISFLFYYLIYES